MRFESGIKISTFFRQYKWCFHVIKHSEKLDCNKKSDRGDMT